MWAHTHGRIETFGIEDTAAMVPAWRGPSAERGIVSSK